MTNPRIAARRLALLLLLPACHTWRPVELAPNTGFETNNRVRVERKAPSTDSVVAAANGPAGKSHAPVVFHGVSVDGDSLFGVRSGSAQPVAIAVADVVRAEERRFSGGRTALLAVGVVVGSFVGLVGLILASGGPAGF